MQDMCFHGIHYFYFGSKNRPNFLTPDPAMPPAQPSHRNLAEGIVGFVWGTGIMWKIRYGKFPMENLATLCYKVALPVCCLCTLKNWCSGWRQGRLGLVPQQGCSWSEIRAQSCTLEQLHGLQPNICQEIQIWMDLTSLQSPVKLLHWKWKFEKSRCLIWAIINEGFTPGGCFGLEFLHLLCNTNWKPLSI